MALNYPTGLITIRSIYPMQTSLIDSIWGIPMVYSSYDGVEITWNSNSSKTINYITFYLVALDKVGGLVPTLGNTQLATLKLVGPVTAGRIVTSKSNGFWQHGLVNYVGINQVDIEYSDGSQITYLNDASLYPRWSDFYRAVGFGDQIKTVKVGASANSPCYVATCVYGSYDCPEVWTLRRFRDNTLAETWYGRIFVRAYYKISPTLVKWFGDKEWFRSMWKPLLDRMVIKLQKKGYESTTYVDKKW